MLTAVGLLVPGPLLVGWLTRECHRISCRIERLEARLKPLAFSLFGSNSGAALAIVDGVLVEVSVMHSVVAIANRNHHLFPA